jgi:hypothetical protein
MDAAAGGSAVTRWRCTKKVAMTVPMRRSQMTRSSSCRGGGEEKEGVGRAGRLAASGRVCSGTHSSIATRVLTDT